MIVNLYGSGVRFNIKSIEINGDWGMEKGV